MTYPQFPSDPRDPSAPPVVSPGDHQMLSYQSVPPYGSAPTLVRLAVIFNFVSVGMDVLYFLGMAGLVIMMVITLSSSTPGPTTRPGSREILAVSCVYAVPAVLSLLAGTAKIIGTFQVLRRRRGSFAWALAIGIVGCVQLWTFFPCCLTIFIPLAVGIFTIVIACLGNVRNYLAGAGTSA